MSTEFNLSKEYIESQYKFYVNEFMLARTAEEQWKLRNAMAKLEGLAIQMYGSKYAESLEKFKVGLQKYIIKEAY